MNEQIIHIQWEGPFPFAQISSFCSNADYGIYQIHGYSSTLGIKALLYIGKAQLQTFSDRLKQKNLPSYELANGSIEVYLGRLAGEATPNDETWNQQIHIAERLLIIAHKPSHNSKDIAAFDVADIHHLHILNWGNRGGLLPEVSGARWSSRFADVPNYAPYGSHDAVIEKETENGVLNPQV